MGNSATLEFEDINEVDTPKRIREFKNKKVEKMHYNKDKFRVTDITRMGTLAIVWFLVRKHKFMLSMVLNIVLFLAWSNVLPMIVDVLRGA